MKSNMTTEQFVKTVHDALTKIETTLTRKRAEYSRNSNPFHNFEKAKEISLHNTRESVAWEFMVKHIQSLRDMISDVETGKFNEIDNSLIDEKCIDIINYTLLIRGMLIERTENVG